MLAAVVLTTCVGLVIAGGVVVRAQPGDSLPTPAAPNGAAKGQPNVPKERTEQSAKKVKELQKERIATLKEVVDLSFRLAKGARVEIGDLLEARMSLLKAELDAAGRSRIASRSTRRVGLAEGIRRIG